MSSKWGLEKVLKQVVKIVIFYTKILTGKVGIEFGKRYVRQLFLQFLTDR